MSYDPLKKANSRHNSVSFKSKKSDTPEFDWVEEEIKKKISKKSKEESGNEMLARGEKQFQVIFEKQEKEIDRKLAAAKGSGSRIDTTINLKKKGVRPSRDVLRELGDIFDEGNSLSIRYHDSGYLSPSEKRGAERLQNRIRRILNSGERLDNLAVRDLRDLSNELGHHIRSR